MRRIALKIEYDGTGLYGFQAQPGLLTVQGLLQEAIAKVANEAVFLHCAGRTDANVHATHQIVHFDTNAKRHIDAWIWGVNSHLLKQISVRFAQFVDYHFHARFTAQSRRYRYIIFNHPIQSSVLQKRASWHYYPLQEDKMRAACPYLLGEQDFSSFRSSQCNSRSPMRSITDVSLKRQGDFIIFEIEANAFLHHMVRNIMGVLLKIGSGLKDPQWMQEVLKAKDRKAAAETAPPEGLYLINVRYPAPYTFPTEDRLFLI